MMQMNQFVYKILCTDITFTLLLSRIVKLKQSIRDNVLINLEEGTNLDELIYIDQSIDNRELLEDITLDKLIYNRELLEDITPDELIHNNNKRLMLLRDHRCYKSLKKVMNQQWGDINSNDLSQLSDNIHLEAYRCYKNEICDVNHVRIDKNTIVLHNQHEGRSYEHIVIELSEDRFSLEYLTSSHLQYSHLVPTRIRCTYNVTENGSTLRIQPCCIC